MAKDLGVKNVGKYRKNELIDMLSKREAPAPKKRGRPTKATSAQKAESVPAAVVYVPDSCTYIGDFAFKDSALTQIRVPADCWLSDTAFEGCRFVQIFSAPGSPAEDYCNSHLNCMFVEE